VVTVIVPAHNEARVIGRLLGRLVPPGGGETGTAGDELDVIVVANGCTDDTAEVAASFGPGVRVVSIPVPSKRQALQAGDEAAKDFPRIYVDADVELGAADIRALAAALARPGALACGPERALDLAGRPWPVRWYYDIWSRLPEVAAGLFGRGVIGLSEAGYARVASLPPLLADDLVASLAFGPGERVIVPGARVVVHTPRTFGDLLRRRVRATMGVTQVEQADGAPASTARTRPRDLLVMARADPVLAPRVALFLAVAVLARRRAAREVRRREYTTWLRDESSRS
jgi:glycosyltransferase involved in cell wall biosynthesis